MSDDFRSPRGLSATGCHDTDCKNGSIIALAERALRSSGSVTRSFWWPLRPATCRHAVRSRSIPCRRYEST